MDISPPSPIYVCGVWRGYLISGGVLPVFGCHFGFCRAKKCNAPTPHMPIGSAAQHHYPDWVQMWVQQSGLMPICPGSQARFRHEVVGLLTPCLYVRGVHALPFDSQLRLALRLNLGRVAKLSQSGESNAAVGIAIAGGVKGL